MTDLLTLSRRSVVSLRAALLAGALSLLASVALTQLPATDHPPTSYPPSAGRAQARASSLPAAAQGAISATLGSADRSYRVRPTRGGGLEAASAPQRLLVRFTRAGVQLSSRKGTLGLSLQAIGYGRSLITVAPAAPVATANRVVYGHAQVSEWYANGPFGIEQGFTLSRAPAGRQSGPLTLSVKLSGNRGARLSGDGRGVTFTHPGAPSLRYGGLVATDSRGHTLHSWIGLGAGRMLLHVDARGAGYPVRIDPLVQQGEPLTVTDAGEVGAGQLGLGVALSGDGNTAIAGGPADSGSAGAVWMFTRSGGVWSATAKLTGGEAASEPGDACGEQSGEEEQANECAFGRSVALSADGKTALVGGPRKTGACARGECPRQGAAWVFTREDLREGGHQVSKWNLDSMLSGGEEESVEGRFGRSVALSGDGMTAVVGAPLDAAGRGAAWVFTRSKERSWDRHPMLTGGEEEQGAGYFGRSVSLSVDGSIALMGAPRDNGLTGAAWVFTRTGSSSTWTHQGPKLTGGGEEGVGRFGFSVALSQDGTTALVGGREDGRSGAAWVFTQPQGATEAWAQQGSKLAVGSELSKAGEFGYSVALSENGDSALVGAPRDSGGGGAAWLFTRSPEGWSMDGSKLAGRTDPDEVRKGRFGSSVGLSADGTTGLIGAPTDSGEAGAVWPFADPATIPLVEELSPSAGPVAGGTSVTIVGSRLGQAGKVRFGGREATFTVNSASSITAVSPAHAPGRVAVIVTTPEGESEGGPSAPKFAYVRAPTVTEASSPDAPTTLSTGDTIGGVLGFGPLCSASLLSRSISVLSHARAAVRLIWRGGGTCAGKLRLSVRVRAGKRVRTKTIGTGSFAIAHGRARTIVVKLNRLGRSLLGAGHGRVRATLVIVQVAGSATSARTASVRLTVRYARKPKARRK